MSFRDWHLPSVTNERILPRHSLGRHDALAARNKPPPAGPERAVQDPPILDFRQVDNAVRLDFDLGGVRLREEDVRYFFGEGLGGEAVE